MACISSFVAFERIPVAGMLLAVDGTVLAINPVACRMVGRDAGAVVGRSLAELMRSDGDLIQILDNSRHRGEVVHELQFDAPGGPRTLECVISAIDADGRVILQVFGIDVTNRQQAEAAARARADAAAQTSAKQRLESLGIVAGGIAHDFNNLLVGVLAEASAAREDRALSDGTRESLRRIEHAARRMAQLTKQMLAYAGRGRFVTTRLDPDDLLEELRETLGQIIEPPLALALAPGAGDAVIEADAGLLRQVVLNLATNAAQAGGTRVEIASRIVVRQPGSWWQLEVGDDGVGIDAALLPRIFEPFYSTRPDCHGLGLSAVQGIVRRLGGDIEVDAKPGQGARFRVRIPVLQGAEPMRRRPTELPLLSAKLAGIKVLIADDEPSVRATVRRLLERRGATVIVCVDGREAEARLHEETFGLVILDVQMPGRSGYDVLSIARLVHPTLPVLMMSGYTEAVRGPDGQEADAFLEKPFTARALDAAIDEVMHEET